MAKGSLRDREFKTQQTERNAALKENTQRAREEAVEEILRVEEEARMRIEENEKEIYCRFFFKENVRNPIWICRDPMIIFSDSRDPMIIFSDSRDPNRLPKTP